MASLDDYHGRVLSGSDSIYFRRYLGSEANYILDRYGVKPSVEAYLGTAGKGWLGGKIQTVIGFWKPKRFPQSALFDLALCQAIAPLGYRLQIMDVAIQEWGLLAATHPEQAFFMKIPGQSDNSDIYRLFNRIAADMKFWGVEMPSDFSIYLTPQDREALEMKVLGHSLSASVKIGGDKRPTRGNAATKAMPVGGVIRKPILVHLDKPVSRSSAQTDQLLDGMCWARADRAKVVHQNGKRIAFSYDGQAKQRIDHECLPGDVLSMPKNQFEVAFGRQS